MFLQENKQTSKKFPTEIQHRSNKKQRKKELKYNLNKNQGMFLIYSQLKSLRNSQPHNQCKSKFNKSKKIFIDHLPTR